MSTKKTRRVRCVGCNGLFDKDDIEYGPDPFAEEMAMGENVESVWECDECRLESAMDI